MDDACVEIENHSRTVQSLSESLESDGSNEEFE